MIAYIDPSSASLVWQGIVAGVLGAGVAIRVFWKRIVGFVTGRSRRDPVEDGAPSAPSNGADPATAHDANAAARPVPVPEGAERTE